MVSATPPDQGELREGFLIDKGQDNVELCMYQLGSAQRARYGLQLMALVSPNRYGDAQTTQYARC